MKIQGKEKERLPRLYCCSTLDKEKLFAQVFVVEASGRVVAGGKYTVLPPICNGLTASHWGQGTSVP